MPWLNFISTSLDSYRLESTSKEKQRIMWDLNSLL
jgi:hypothetical protein